MFTSSSLWSNRAWKVSLEGVPRLRYLRYIPLSCQVFFFVSLQVLTADGPTSCTSSNKLLISPTIVLQLFLKKNQSTPRPSEHPPVMGEKVSKRIGGIFLSCLWSLLGIFPPLPGSPIPWYVFFLSRRKFSTTLLTPRPRLVELYLLTF